MHGAGEGWLRRERTARAATRAGSANGRREWAARAGGASGRCSRVARKRSCADGTVLGKFRPQAPLERLGDWGTAPRPHSVPGEVAWWLGWPCGDSDGNSPAMPPVGRVKNARKTTAGALGQAGRSGRTNPQLRAARGAAPKRARMLTAARASRGPRATSREIPESGERRNPHPQQQQGRPHLRADVRTHARCGFRDDEERRRRSRRVRAHHIDRRQTHSAPGCAAGRKRGNRQ